MTIDLPGLVLVVMVWAYWGRVAAMSLRVRRRTRSLAGIVPSQSLERLMWLVWLVLVPAWLLLPWLALRHDGGHWALPPFARDLPYAALRWVAAGLGVACLVLSLRAWRQMGRSWRMAVAPGAKTELVTGGPFARVRHPIYALSMLLMICTLAVVPTPAMLAIAVLHIALMVTKAHNEERYLLATHGEAYADYCRRTGRFLPRLGRAQ